MFIKIVIMLQVLDVKQDNGVYDKLSIFVYNRITLEEE